jgi:hypothetical protein
VNNRLKITCKEAIVAQLRYYSGVYLECFRKTANCHDRRSSGLYFIYGLQTMKLDIQTRASHRIHIAEENKIIENAWKTLL